MHSLAIHPDATLRVPSLYCGSIDYYAAIAACGNSYVDTCARFDKRAKSVHRAVIADVNGPLRLTVPVAKPAMATGARWCDILVSAHGNWPDVHRVALESAYGRTPYFEFYADRFLPLLRACDQPVTELNSAIDARIREILMLPQPLAALPEENVMDYDAATLEPVEYYQVRRHLLGFIPHLSVLDLIFNMGPESPLIIKKILALK